MHLPAPFETRYMAITTETCSKPSPEARLLRQLAAKLLFFHLIIDFCFADIHDRMRLSRCSQHSGSEQNYNRKPIKKNSGGRLSPRQIFNSIAKFQCIGDPMQQGSSRGYRSEAMAHMSRMSPFVLYQEGTRSWYNPIRREDHLGIGSLSRACNYVGAAAILERHLK